MIDDYLDKIAAGIASLGKKLAENREESSFIADLFRSNRHLLQFNLNNSLICVPFIHNNLDFIPKLSLYKYRLNLDKIYINILFLLN